MIQNKLLRVLMLHSQNTGVGLFRIMQPAWMLQKKKLAEVKTIPFYWRSHKKDMGDPLQDKMLKVLEPMCKWADLIVLSRRDNRQHAALLKAMQALGKPVIYETDDFVQYVPPYNPGARFYIPGSENTDVWPNYCLREADAIQVSTEGLKRLYRQFNRPIYVLPNCIDRGYWKFEREDRENERLRIGWAGANAHWGNLRILKDVVPKILDDFPEVDLYFVGPIPSFWEEMYRKNKKRVFTFKWANLQHWPEKLASLRFDIGLAPLLDNYFNRAKSHLRYLEYSINKVATVCSPVDAYSHTVKNGVNGLFAKEKKQWYSAIARLIKDDTLRKEIANNAYQNVLENWDLEKKIPLWLETYLKVYRDYYNNPNTLHNLTPREELLTEEKK